LAEWLNIPFERIVAGGNSRESPRSVLDIVVAHLRADPKLTPEQARALEEMFRIAYNLTPEQARALAEVLRIAYNQLSMKK
jgi:hypothetical protein